AGDEQGYHAAAADRGPAGGGGGPAPRPGSARQCSAAAVSAHLDRPGGPWIRRPVAVRFRARDAVRAVRRAPERSHRKLRALPPQQGLWTWVWVHPPGMLR